MYKLDALEVLEKLHKRYLENRQTLKESKVISLEAYKAIKEEREKLYKLLVEKRKQRLFGMRK